MPKGADRAELTLSDEELREVRLALALRIAELGKTLPSPYERFLDRVLRLVGVAEDEAGDRVQAIGRS